MFERTTRIGNVVYVPWNDVDPDDAVRFGAAWLREQPGHRLVLLHTKGMYSNNPLLPRLTAGTIVERPPSLWRAHWGGGPVLAPWPTEEVLGFIADRLVRLATGVCVLPWGDDPFLSAWLSAHKAVNLLTGHAESTSADDLLSPVVRVAMEHLSQAVNHNNALVSGYEKSYAVRTLQELRRSGHALDVDAICAWALANGFTTSEVKHLRQYVERVQSGRGFRLRETAGPKPGSAHRWEEEASAAPLAEPPKGA